MGRHAADDPAAPGRRTEGRHAPALGPVTDPVLLDRVAQELERRRSDPPGPRAEVVRPQPDLLDGDEEDSAPWAPPRPATGRIQVMPTLLPGSDQGGPAEEVAEAWPSGPAIVDDPGRGRPVADAPEVPEAASAVQAVDDTPAVEGRPSVGLSVPTLALVAAIGLAAGVLLSVLAYLRY